MRLPMMVGGLAGSFNRNVASSTYHPCDLPVALVFATKDHLTVNEEALRSTNHAPRAIGATTI